MECVADRMERSRTLPIGAAQPAAAAAATSAWVLVNRTTYAPPMICPVQMAPPRRVAVIGGGIAGNAAALALARKNIPCTLFDMGRGVGGRCGVFAGK